MSRKISERNLNSSYTHSLYTQYTRAPKQIDGFTDTVWGCLFLGVCVENRQRERVRKKE